MYANDTSILVIATSIISAEKLLHSAISATKTTKKIKFIGFQTK